jgi:hypothetical protein
MGKEKHEHTVFTYYITQAAMPLLLRRFFMDYKRNSRYFSKPKYGFAIFLIIVGIVACLIASRIGGAAWLIAIGLIGIGILVIVKTGSNRPTDTEMDAQVNADFNSLFEKALKKHGLTADQVQKIPHIVLGGYMIEAALANEAATNAAAENMLKGLAGQTKSTNILEAINGSNNMAAQLQNDISGMTGIEYKKGKDNIPRASAVSWTVFLFSDSQVFTYTRQFSLVSPDVKEAGSEYFYQDIVSISTDATSQGHVFQMKISDGSEIMIPYSAENDADTVQRSITALKQLVRDIKSKR